MGEIQQQAKRATKRTSVIMTTQKQIEVLIDKEGFLYVVEMLSNVCSEKADAFAQHKNDLSGTQARAWQLRADSLLEIE